MRSAARRLGLEIAGWTLLVLGIAALVLPGPGLLMVFAALAILSQQYEWAERRVNPIKYRALKGAAEGVETLPRMILSIGAVLLLAGCGVLWIWGPPAPDWWFFEDAKWWLPGGIATGITQIASALIAAALIVYSYRRFHGRPEALAELKADIEESDREFKDR
jgi:hypothetical protein